MPIQINDPQLNAPMQPLASRGHSPKEMVLAMVAKSQDWYSRLNARQRLLVNVGVIAGSIAGVFIVILHRQLIGLLVELLDWVYSLGTLGGVILWLLVFGVGFPPLIGFSALSMLCGMVYGFPKAWPLLASASVLGSVASFVTFKYLLYERSVRLVQLSDKFRAFLEILTDESENGGGLLILILLRLCPLPYSLSNGALALIPNLSIATFVLASVITSPKMFIHIFVGWKIKELGDNSRSGGSKIVDLISILITMFAASAVTYVIYYKMQIKLAGYHEERMNSNNINDDLIFGNFDDENLYDMDNFIIDDEIEVDNRRTTENLLHKQDSHTQV